jgi:hypothetical protein
MHNSQNLLWSSLDVNGVITAALGQMLRELLKAQGSQHRWLRAANSQHLLQLAGSHKLGLALWCVDDDLQLPQVCQSLCEVRERSPDTVCVAYAEVPCWALLSVLIEAGAQLVVRDVPNLQLGLARALSAAPRSAQGLHPLTTGLFEQLPWGAQ